MKNFDEIEKFVRHGKPVVKTSRQLDRQTLDDSYVAMEGTIESTSKDGKSGKLKFAVQNRAIKLIAAAAVIIVVTSLFLDRERQTPEITTPYPQETKLISMMSLRLSYQRGGFDALDQQFRETLDVLGPRSSGVSMKELLEGTNGS